MGGAASSPSVAQIETKKQARRNQKESTRSPQQAAL